MGRLAALTAGVDVFDEIHVLEDAGVCCGGGGGRAGLALGAL